MKARGSLSAFMAFFVGVPAGLALMIGVHQGTIPLDPHIAEYVSHPVEMAEVVMFCCALGALIGKWLSNMGERLAFMRKLLPAWDSQPHSVTEAKTLLDQMAKSSRAGYAIPFSAGASAPFSISSTAAGPPTISTIICAPCPTTTP